MNYETVPRGLKNIINFRLMFESEIALFLFRYGVGMYLMKNWQGIPTARLNLGGEVMVP